MNMNENLTTPPEYAAEAAGLFAADAQNTYSADIGTISEDATIARFAAEARSTLPDGIKKETIASVGPILNKENYIVDPANETVTKGYTMEELDSYREKVGALNYVEASQSLTEVESAQKSLVQVHQLVTMVGSMGLGDNADPMNIKLMQTNALRQSGVSDDVDTFFKKYPAYIADMEALADALKERIDNYKDETKGTTFYTSQLLEILHRKQKSYDPDSAEYLRFARSIAAFEDRTNVDLLKRYITNTLTNKRTMRQYTRGVAATKDSHIVANYMSDLSSMVVPGQLIRIGKYLDEHFLPMVSIEDRDNIINRMFFAFSRIAKREKESGYDSHLKVFLMNILDDESGEYDYGNGPDELHKIILDLVLLVMSLA